MMIKLKNKCYHCGEECVNDEIHIGDKLFCCSGCKSVYSILNQHELEGYYCLNETPGNTLVKVNEVKFQFLDDESIAAKIYTFKNDKQTQVQFYLPQIHCSSCLWLLENLHKLNEGIISSQVNFNEKKVSISFHQKIITLRQLAELLASVGYEPYITLQDYEEKDKSPVDRKSTIKLGIAGFCFANIMLISFPEYLGLEFSENKTISIFFRYANLLLSLPVFFYAAQEFFINAWSSIKQRFLNIDAPIALAITITFVRSIYEIVTNQGAGYLDSMSGIVFFMLIGRSLQYKTFTNLKFNRDYKSYFPISIAILENGVEKIKKIQDVNEGDILRLHHQEIIPVDCILSSRSAEIDYSFVTGENELTTIKTGEIIYAGGKIQNTAIEVVSIKPFSQNSFTSLWNNQAFKKTKDKTATFIETISKYFSAILLLIATTSYIFWQITDATNAWNAFTAVLIVACPCTLLLASSYTYGFIIELFSKEGMFVKNVETINTLSQIDHIVFDKTGTLSEINKQEIQLFTESCSKDDMAIILSVISHSSHPLSKVIVKYYHEIDKKEIHHIKELAGKGVEAWHDDQYIKIGSAQFVGLQEIENIKGSLVYFSIDKVKNGYFVVSNIIKSGVEELLGNLTNYKLSLLSGDNQSSYEQMKHLFPDGATLLFQQSPQAKLDYIKTLQEKNEKVLMIGDGINDAGALKQSDLGISVVDANFSFSPASDAILNTSKTADLFKFIQSAKAVKKLIIGTFIYSLFYNIIGLSIAVSANMKPVIAAILMPASSISVILIAYIGTKIIYNRYLKNKSNQHGKV
ncbi:MAG TPA: heavy metal translocating P-type ATPase metal-binding domain-containing protein [Chitinophagaceae bacterium]|nr:heavy metal translocating P-type ATPase metal-binding domain-containing protein [Chitinophagaceae bacterium]